MKVDELNGPLQQSPLAFAPPRISSSASSSSSSKVVVIEGGGELNNNNISNSAAAMLMSVDDVLASIDMDKNNNLAQQQNINIDNNVDNCMLVRSASEGCLTEGTAPTLEMELDEATDIELSSHHLEDENNNGSSAPAAQHEHEREEVVGNSSSESDKEDDDDDDESQLLDAMDTGSVCSINTTEMEDVEDNMPLAAPGNLTGALVGVNARDSLMMIPPRARPAAPRRSCIKQASLLSLSTEHIVDKKSVWKSLPRPNLEKILDHTCPGRLESTARAPRTTRIPRRVSFDSICIREYEQTLGDNPSVSYGPPIQLDWKYEEYSPIGLEDYEENRKPRRKMRQMVLNYYHRRNVLTWCCGATEEDLKRAERRANKIKRERALTVAMLPARRFEGFFESAARKVKSSKKNNNKNGTTTTTTPQPAQQALVGSPPPPLPQALQAPPSLGPPGPLHQPPPLPLRQKQQQRQQAAKRKQPSSVPQQPQPLQQPAPLRQPPPAPLMQRSESEISV